MVVTMFFWMLVLLGSAVLALCAIFGGLIIASLEPFLIALGTLIVLSTIPGWASLPNILKALSKREEKYD